jgi:large subunit ribosomal protein L29
MTKAELEAAMNKLKADLFLYRFQHATNQLSNPMVMVVCKKDIAKIKTILRQRELNISSEPAVAAAAGKTKKSKK